MSLEWCVNKVCSAVPSTSPEMAEEALKKNDLDVMEAIVFLEKSASGGGVGEGSGEEGGGYAMGGDLTTGSSILGTTSTGNAATTSGDSFNGSKDEAWTEAGAARKTVSSCSFRLLRELPEIETDYLRQL